eukprot:9008443-Pyramimonas_sp.AAC.1
MAKMPPETAQDGPKAADCGLKTAHDASRGPREGHKRTSNMVQRRTRHRFPLWAFLMLFTFSPCRASISVGWPTKPPRWPQEGP